MKNVLVVFATFISVQAFGSVNLDLDKSYLFPYLNKYLAQSLSVCSQNVVNEKFTVVGIDVVKKVVDQGVRDFYYTIALDYSVNNKSIGLIEVKMNDMDYHNYKKMSDKVSFEISNDSNGICK